MWLVYVDHISYYLRLIGACIFSVQVKYVDNTNKISANVGSKIMHSLHWTKKKKISLYSIFLLCTTSVSLSALDGLNGFSLAEQS